MDRNDYRATTGGTVAGDIHFKHVYGRQANELGALGFPRSQSPSTALSRYQRGDRVLLAVTKNSDLPKELWEGLDGKIFGVCTLIKMDVRTAEVANPVVARRYPEVVERWPNATPIDEMWSLGEPVKYDELAGGELTRIAKARRGQLIHLGDYPDIKEMVEAWLSTIELNPIEVYRSPRTLSLLNARQSQHSLRA
jgi:hypothetical protein